MNPEKSTDDRLADEAAFFDRQAQTTLGREPSFRLGNTKTYAELFGEVSHLKGVVPHFGAIEGKTLLDMACGDGWTTLYFARSGAQVSCCDISPKCIELVRRYAETNDLASRINAEVMNAEEMSYPDEAFDYVFVNAGLHHTDLSKSVAEIRRVLKPGGKLAMVEDHGHHPLFAVYRFFTGHRHTKFEKALGPEDVAMISSMFTDVTVRYHGLLNVVSATSKLSRVLESIDKRLLSWFPFLRFFARLVQIYAVKPAGPGPGA